MTLVADLPSPAAHTMGKHKKKPVPKLIATHAEGVVVHDLTKMKPQRGVKTIIATESRDNAIRECRRKVEKISRECRMDNVKYRDPHFDLSTMKTFCLEGLPQERCDREGVAWPSTSKRVGDIYKDPKFIVDGIDAGDIKQGGAGDCWFLAAVATIANMPTLLESICVARDEHVGVYGFIFFRDGEWISEVIDDQLFITHPNYAEADDDMKRAFPTEAHYVDALQRGSAALHYAKCADSNETWLPLLEKAYAKAHGDYSAIEGGFTGEGVEDLTGGVTTEIICEDILDKDRFWTEELLKVNKELLFACAISGSSAWQVNGIVTGHAYSVLQAVEINGKRLVQVRNPWGQSEWDGAWSDGSPEWTPEWMTLLNHRFGDDGAFWMSYEDFLKTFTDLDRTRIFTPEWTVAQAWTQYEVGWPATFAQHEFTITLTRETPVVIVLQQADNRYFTGLEGQYRFELHFRVRKQGESEYYARSKQSIIMNRSVNKELQLGEGTWVVSFKVSRSLSGMPRRTEYIGDFVKKQSAKFLQTSRNFDYAHAKGADGAQWESPVDAEGGSGGTSNTLSTKPRSFILPGTKKAGSKKSVTVEVEPEIEEEAEEDEDAEQNGDGEQEEEQPEAEHEEDEDEEDEEEEDHSDEDNLAVVGIRVHAKDRNLKVEVIPTETADTELDPDDSSVVAFLHSAADKSTFLSTCAKH